MRTNSFRNIEVTKLKKKDLFLVEKIRRNRCKLELVSADFDWGFANEMCCSKIYYLPSLTESKNTFNFCKDFKHDTERDSNFLRKANTGGESLCYGCVPETKQGSSQSKSPNSPRLKKARQVTLNVKTTTNSMMFYYYYL